METTVVYWVYIGFAHITSVTPTLKIVHPGLFMMGKTLTSLTIRQGLVRQYVLEDCLPEGIEGAGMMTEIDP